MGNFQDKMAPRIHVLRPHVMNYAWGRPAATSAVARLAGVSATGGNDDGKKYAELWMGTHPNGPGFLIAEGVPLADYIAAHPDALGPHEGGSIPFLFKVLSVAKALSVQSHPTKELAAQLRARDPKNYPDANHKPEMALALSEFEVLCGFRPAKQIVENLRAFPETAQILPEDVVAPLVAAGDNDAATRTALRALFTRLMETPAEKVESALASLTARLSSKTTRSDLESLLLRLRSQYPDKDVGVLSPLLLNHIRLRPGQSVFLGPNEPHAYLDGECIEAMACSDNTIRAGLTPKFKDVPTLVSTLTYSTAGPTYLTPKQVIPGVEEYRPPVPEFAVQKITSGATTLPDVHASSIVIVITGSASVGGLAAKAGSVLFVEAAAGPAPVNSTSADFLAFRAFSQST